MGRRIEYPRNEWYVEVWGLALSSIGGGSSVSCYGPYSPHHWHDTLKEIK
jgi:hypothetical protein